MQLFDRLRELNERIRPRGSRLAARARGARAQASARRRSRPWLDGLKVRRRDAELIAAAIEDGPRIAEQLGQDSLTPADVVALAEPRAPDAPLFALALADRPQLHDFFERLRGDPSSRSTGADLAAARARRVAASGGDPGRGAAPQAERRAGRARVGARSRAGAGRAVVSVPLLRWEVPGPYDVVFTTRARRRQRRARSSRSTSAAGRATTSSASTRTAAACAPRSARTSRTSRSASRRTPRSSTAPRPAPEALPGTGSGPTSPGSRCSRSAPTAR